MVLIAPSLFDVPEGELEHILSSISNADLIHVDIAHPGFVETKDGKESLFYDFSKLTGLLNRVFLEQRTCALLDLHLMVPAEDIPPFLSLAGNVGSLTFHLEAAKKAKADPLEIINTITEAQQGSRVRTRPGLALNPDTPIEEVFPYLEALNGGSRWEGGLVTLMSVVPGKGGQNFIDVTGKIKELKEALRQHRYDKVKIEVDGGIKLDNRYVPIMAGADILVSGSGVFKHEKYTPKEVITRMREFLALGSDHGGYELKTVLSKYMEQKEIPFKDFGCYSQESVDYPKYADKIVQAIEREECTRGILICGTGIGMSIRANRYPGIRAALCHDEFTAEMSREHNNSNILVLGGRTTALEKAASIFDKWYNTSFEGEMESGARHFRRVEMLDEEISSTY